LGAFPAPLQVRTKQNCGKILCPNSRIIGYPVDVKRKFFKLKSDKIQVISKHRRSSRGTGGGPPPPPLSPITQKTEILMGDENAKIEKCCWFVGSELLPVVSKGTLLSKRKLNLNLIILNCS